MQGSGYEALFFYADENYISKVYDTYAPEAKVYTYNDYAWVNTDDRMVSFPKINDMKNEEKFNVAVLIIYNNGNVNAPHNSGIYINQTQGYICYFAQ